MTPLLTLLHILADLPEDEGGGGAWIVVILIAVVGVAAVALAVMWLSSDRRQNRGRD